jgi:PAS domain S-box-containing protein
VADQVEQLVQTIVRTGEPITGIEVNGQRPDGSNVDRVWITYWHPLKDRAGAVVGVNVVAEEITRRKRADAELATSRERLVSLNETLAERVEEQAQERDRIWKLSQDLLAVSDARGIILNVNPAWSTTLGWSRNDLIGEPGDWLIHPDDRERSRAELATLAAGGSTRHLQNRLRCKDGSYRWLSWFAVSDKDLIYASARDVTDLRQAWEELDTLRRQLAAASRRAAMGAMSASISHEIKQPLAAVAMNASAGLRWLRGSDLQVAEARTALAQIVQNVHRINEVIDGVRSMIKKDTGKPILVNLLLLVREVLALAQGELDAHQIALRNDVRDGLPSVMAERVQLQQVLLNLVMNAIEAMSSVNGRERRLTVASELDPQSGITISVEDTGIGIAPSHLPRIFDAFFTTKSDGMGLGLSISRSIVEAHGGTLMALPRNPHGMVFCLTLPIPAAPVAN